MEKSRDSSSAASGDADGDYCTSHAPDDSIAAAEHQHRSQRTQSDTDYTRPAIKARLESYYKHAWSIAELFCDQSLTVSADGVDQEVGLSCHGAGRHD